MEEHVQLTYVRPRLMCKLGLEGVRCGTQWKTTFLDENAPRPIALSGCGTRNGPSVESFINAELSSYFF